MSVEAQHPQYSDMIDEWQLVKAAARGQKAIKALKDKVLPKPIGDDEERYKQYLKRAVYTNFTGRTKAGLVGAAFRVSPEIELSATLEYMNDNADGCGQSLEQLTKDVLSELMVTGRQILIADYPAVEEGLTLEQQQARGLQAYIKIYDACDVINWKTKTVDGKEQLYLLVLRESYDQKPDDFDHAKKERFRVLRLDNGYTQEVWEDGEIVDGPLIVKDARGNNFKFIPAFFVGSQNNDPSVDPIPLADIAHVNIAHYRNSADLEENCFIHGQITLGISSDLSVEDWKKANPNGVSVGARTGHFLGSNGHFESVQASPNQLADGLMLRKEQQMIALGAKLIENRNSQGTATEAMIDATGENSVLSDLVKNTEEAIQRCLEWCGMFMGDESESVFEMNRQFFQETANPQTVVAAIQMYDRGLAGKTDLIQVGRKSGIIAESRTDEEVMNEAEEQSPMAGIGFNEQQTVSN